MPYHPRAVVRRPFIVMSLLLVAVLAGCAGPAKAPPKRPVLAPSTSKLSEKAKLEQQQFILKIRNQTLAQLYKLKPQTQAEIEQAAGYGVFEINGLNVVLDNAHGRGVVVDKASGRTTYMLLARTDLDPGARIRPYRQVLIFQDQQKLHRFVTDSVPANNFNDPSIRIYQLNDKGVALQADWGARYFRDRDLN